jgi:hypothetical protein
MRSFLPAVLILIGSTASAPAAVVGVPGGVTADFSAGYAARDLIGAPDPWPDSGAVTNGTVTIDPGGIVDVIFRGGEDDAWSADFGDVFERLRARRQDPWTECRRFSRAVLFE